MKFFATLSVLFLAASVSAKCVKKGETPLCKNDPNHNQWSCDNDQERPKDFGATGCSFIDGNGTKELKWCCKDF